MRDFKQNNEIARSDAITVSSITSSNTSLAKGNNNSTIYQLTNSKIAIVRLIFDTQGNWSLGTDVTFTLTFPSTLTPFAHNGFGTGMGFAGQCLLAGNCNYAQNTRTLTVTVRPLVTGTVLGYQPNICIVIRT